MSNQLGFEVTVNRPLNEAVDLVTNLLKTEGFGILTRIDVQATLKEKIGAEFRPYVILGACNPGLAHKALQADAWLGLLLPCNVTVEQPEDNVSIVRIANPGMMADLSTSTENIAAVAGTATQKLLNVINQLKQA